MRTDQANADVPSHHPLTGNGNGRLAEVDPMVTSTLGVRADLVGIPDVDVEGVDSFRTTVHAVKDDNSVDIGDRECTICT